MAERKSDIVIVGAGIAGCIAALALHPHYQVIVVDKLATAKDKVGECLPPATVEFSKSLTCCTYYKARNISLVTV